jgi:hypothetical protein
VARIVAGQPDPAVTAPAAPGPLPQHLHEYLRGVGEHQRPLRDYQRILDQRVLDAPDTEGDHGQ